MNPNDKEVLAKMFENERNREYFRWYVSAHNMVKHTKKRKRGTRKMNTTPKPTTPISYQQLSEMLHEGTLYEHHSAYFSGYVSRTRKDEDIIAYPYKGHFGVGYVVDFPNWNSTRFSYRTYYIFTE